MSSTFRRSVRHSRHALAAALALAAAPALAQSSPYSQTVFFGDSLTDSGYFRPAIVQVVGPSGAILGRFTTNPGLVWAEWVADYYGTSATPNGLGQTGSNYAVGGARVGVDTVADFGGGVLIPIPSLATQTANYLAANGGKADPNGLYTVWGGANDLFAVAGGAPAEATIGAAVTAQVGIVATLQAAGARYVIVPTIPDVGLTPRFGAGGTPASALGTQLATSYNTALFNGLAGQGLHVIPVDTFHFLQEVAANPGLYGFSNVTSPGCSPLFQGGNSLFCNPASYVDPNVQDKYLFADGVHPSGAAHKAISELALNMLEAPRQVAVLPHSASVTGRARADVVGAHLGGRPEGDGMRWWSNLRGDFQRYGDGDVYDGAVPALAGGVDWTSGDFVFGGFAGYGRGKLDFGRNKGEFDQSEATLGGFVGWYGEGGGWVNGQLSYSQLGFDVDRDVQLGPATRRHSGSPDGKNITAALNAGWNLGDAGGFQHGPVLSVVAQRIDVDGYRESDPALSTSLAYRDQSFDSLIGSAGWQASFNTDGGVSPYARATYDREFEDPDAQVFARSQSLPGTLDYAVPGLAFDRNYGTVTIGARIPMFELEANIGGSATVGQKGGHNASVFATLGRSF